MRPMLLINLNEERFLKKEGINIFILPPSKTIGIVPIKIDLNNLPCMRYSKNFFED